MPLPRGTTSVRGAVVEGGEHRWVFCDDDKTSEAYAEQIERCPACGRTLEREEMAKAATAS